MFIVLNVTVLTHISTVLRLKTVVRRTCDVFHFVKNSKRRVWEKMGSRTRSCCIGIRVITKRVITRSKCM